MNISKAFNAIFPLFDFLYILQLEEYYTRFYLKTSSRKLFHRNFQKHDTLRVTGRIQTTGSVAFLFWIFSLIYFYLFTGPSTLILIFFLVVTTLALPYWIALANIILAPMYEYFKRSIQRKAMRHFKDMYSDSIVIAIAGSYGKTTTKYFLTQLLATQFKVIATPGNINTPTGIAQWVLKLTTHYDIVIVEMDAYEQGEIARSAKITPPNVAIITSIGDQHLMRFKLQQNVANAIYEVVTSLKSGGKYCTSKQAQDLLKKYHINPKNSEKIELAALPKKTNIESESGLTCLQIAISVAHTLGVRADFTIDAVKKLETPDRRQKISEREGYTVIDDSYNISPTTAIAALKQAQYEKKRLKKDKLVVITGGIPELGDENKHANTEYGMMLSQYADKVILLSTILSQEISQKLSVPYVSAKSMNEAWEYILKGDNPKDTLVLMQPELTDVYY